MTDQLPPLRISLRDVCQHLRREVHPERPEVTCADCDAVLDPYWCLRDLAAYDAHLDERIALADKAVAEANRRIQLANARVRGVR